MWIKSENGYLLNMDHIVLITREAMYAPGSHCTLNDVLQYRVAASQGSENRPKVVVADKLTFAESSALLDYLFDLTLDDLNLASVPYLLDCIRREVEPETVDDQVHITEQGRALLRDQDAGKDDETARQLDGVRELDHYGEAR